MTISNLDKGNELIKNIRELKERRLEIDRMIDRLCPPSFVKIKIDEGYTYTPIVRVLSKDFEKFLKEQKGLINQAIAKLEEEFTKL